MRKEWIIKEKTQSETNKSLIERLLATRGIIKEEEVKEFLNPLESKLTHPNAFCDMQKAVERLSQAIDDGENILIYGDFDADGVTSTSVLIRTFEFLGANFSHFIPDREKEGHGLNSKALIKLMTTHKPKVIITVDCGVSNVSEVDFLNSFKVDVIITDHHEAGDVLPNALAIINPKAPNALDESLSAKEIEYLAALAGVGVAFKVAQALLERYNKVEFVYDIMPYVAVGTVADVVPLIGENRYFVAKGLQLISSGKHYGIKRLLENAGYALETGITSENVAFGIAPRINASGRLDTVEDALKVLTSDNHQEIEMSIISLNNYNKVRQELCDNTFLEAQEMLRVQGNDGSAIILYKPDWHIGVVGIVASKLVEKYYKPTFLMTYSEETKQVRCSARSIEGVHLYEVISASSEMLDGFGGHALAAGLSFDPEKVVFEDVKKSLDKSVEESLGGKKLVPTISVDLELNSGDVDINLISDMSRLEPFGAANPSPIFVLKNMTLLQKKLMGSNRNHLKLIVEDKNHNSYDCIWWSKGDISLNVGDKLDIAFSPQINTFNGQTTIQLILQDIHSENLVYESEKEEDVAKNASNLKIYDHRKKSDILQNVNDYVKTSKYEVLVFAEDKQIIARLKPYSALLENVYNRTNLKKSDVVMFFDYPSSVEIFDEILMQTEAKHIHFMNYDVKKVDEKEVLKVFSGMVKYSCSTLNGVFDLEKSAAFLAQTRSVVTSLLEVFAESSMIKIIERDELEYKIEFLNNVELSKTLHCVNYKEFLCNLREVEEYKLSLLDEELNNLCN